MPDNEFKRPIEASGDTKEALPGGVDEAAAIPQGTIDPVYEAKARVLNHAASHLFLPLGPTTNALSDSRDWHGMVPVATLHCCWFRVGQ